MITKNVLIAFAVSAFVNFSPAIAQNTQADGAPLLHFRFARSSVDGSYRGNDVVLRTLHEWLADSLRISRTDSVSIFAYSSPEGMQAFNERLSHERAAAVKEYISRAYPRLSPSLIRTHSRVSDWQALLPLVSCRADIPFRNEAAEILALEVSGEKKESLLKSLHGGIPYKYIFRYLLPDLRNAAVCMVWRKPRVPLPIGKWKNAAIRKDSSASAYVNKLSLPASATSARFPAGRGERKPLFALKTNLLFDLALMPNIEVEVPVRKHWSVNGELMFPWWLFKGDKYCLQILYGGAEGRYWLGDREKRKVLTGHFLGLYAGGGKYDLQWKRNGYQGEFFIAAGLSYGYAMPIARNFRLEFNLGVGVLHTNYRHYIPVNNYKTLLWQNNGKYTWFGPTKAKISLVWMLSRKVKGGIK